ncbi:DUF1672 family protein, partial [Staphylococcus aureus]|uniref:DUF1672 family protein n=1 Tax=Staphylococcus aureus TaxID=1280 RepID=UPI0011A38088
KYLTQAFQPPPEKHPLQFPKNHKHKIPKPPQQFFIHNFPLKLKPTNLVPTPHPLQLYLHSHHHDILFNPSIPFHKSIIHTHTSLT